MAAAQLKKKRTKKMPSWIALGNRKLKKNNDLQKTNFFVKNKDLILRIIFTIFILLLIRAGMYLTVPGIQIASDYEERVSSIQFFQLLATLGGGSIGKFSILTLGVSPYITASIIVQLLSTDVIPVLSS